MVNINIDIPDEIHKRIKIIAAMQDSTTKDLIITALEESVKNAKQ